MVWRSAKKLFRKLRNSGSFSGTPLTIDQRDPTHVRFTPESGHVQAVVTALPEPSAIVYPGVYPGAFFTCRCGLTHQRDDDAA
jgi:hypothetical protein